MKNALIAILVLIILGFGFYYYFGIPGLSSTRPETPAVVDTTPTTTPPVATTTPEDKTKTVIGQSKENRDIIAYHYGTGTKEVLFVGGIHGGYEWNTSLVAYNVMDYLEQHPEAIPQGVKVTVIPVLNPDGLSKVVAVNSDGRFAAADVSSVQSTLVSGRFNANTVDLNRNFDCDWQAEGKWQSTTVSGGTAAFSEPESQAMRDYIQAHTPAGVVVWYSSAGGVYASNCHDGVLPETNTLTMLYAKASGYPAHESFDFYATTGDMVNWLAKQKIPAISVLLTNHTDTEWSKNQAGIDAVLKHFAQ